MEREEFESEDVCSQCGTRIHAGTEGAFGFGDENVLCRACATARGGRYDAERDEWDVAPDLTGLRDEAYGATPGEAARRRR
jgi:hypothetical protein